MKPFPLYFKAKISGRCYAIVLWQRQIQSFTVKVLPKMSLGFTCVPMPPHKVHQISIITAYCWQYQHILLIFWQYQHYLGAFGTIIMNGSTHFLVLARTTYSRLTKIMFCHYPILRWESQRLKDIHK